jgi:hypothetical protein
VTIRAGAAASFDPAGGVDVAISLLVLGPSGAPLRGDPVQAGAAGCTAAQASTGPSGTAALQIHCNAAGNSLSVAVTDGHGATDTLVVASP